VACEDTSQSIMQSRTKHADDEEEDIEIQQFKVSLYEIIASAVLFYCMRYICCIFLCYFCAA
jgi:hypothetical protein